MRYADNESLIGHQSCANILIIEKLRGSVGVNPERAIDVAGDVRLATFRTVIVDGTAYFNKDTKDLPRVYL